MAQAIYRVYRPSTFKEVSGQEHVVRTLQNQYASGALAHAYLFTGPRGVGKTTTARLIAKLANCELVKESEPCNACPACVSITSGQALDVYEIDAASHTGVENVRETVIDSVRFSPNILKKKVYIIDEVHMLSTSAFNALLKTLEEPPEHAMFVLATTEIHKVPETIISRCQRFDFKRISANELVARMQGIVKAEGVKVDEDVLREIARHSGGCARDSESMLGQVLALGEKEITMEQASLVLPVTQTLLVEAFSKTLHAGQAGEAITQLNTYLEQGVDLRHFISDVISWLRDRLLESVAGQQTHMDISFLHTAIEELLQAQRGIRGENIPQLPIELAIVKICGMTQARSTQPLQETKKQEVVQTPAVKKEPEVPVAEAVVEVEVPAEIKEVEKVFDTVPVIDLEEVMKKWPQVYEQIKTCNASLPMMMKSCEVNGVEGGYVELGFEYDLYVQTVNQEKNSKLIEGVFENVLGKRMRVRAVQTKKPEQDETVQGLIQEFGGSMV